MTFVLLLVDFTLMISVLSLLSWNHKGSNPNITPQLKYFWRDILVVDYESTIWNVIYGY
jgi:hypothetical protein